jgi:hypothetical protein
MSIDRTLRLTWRNFATLWLLVALITIPVHLGHSFVYRRVIGLRELHPAIEQLPANRQVRSVGRSDLEEARSALAVIVIVELALLPLVAGATRRALQVDAAGGLPTVLDSWTHSLGARRRPAPAGSGVAAAAAGLAISAATGYLIWQIGQLVIEPVGDDATWAAVGLAGGITGATAAPFFLVPIALLSGRAKGEGLNPPTL